MKNDKRPVGQANTANHSAMRAELTSVLADPTFVRSPVLARLLTYLVETTLDGGGRSLKSYSVAVDGLGRRPDLDSQVDTYARVHIARLRKALDAFYAAAGENNSPRLTIDSGSYQVRLADNAHSSSARWSAQRFRFEFGRPFAGVVLVPGAATLLAVCTAAVIHWQAQSREALLRWRTDNFPSVIVTVTDQSPASARGQYANLMRQQLLAGISRYQGIQVNFDNSANATYEVAVTLHRSGPDLIANTFVVNRRSKRLMWSATNVVEVAPDETSSSDSGYVQQTAFLIAHGAGIIHSAERQLNHRPDRPYGCWLRFAMQMQDNRFGNDTVLGQCAEQWHDASPDHQIPAGLHAWALLDRSIVAVTDSRREELVDQAIEIIERARAMSPESPFLCAVAVRAYAIAHEDTAMRIAADQALRLNPGNIDIQGLIGTMLTLRSDPRGEALLDDAIARRSNPPPWYFIAKFVAAMMREDTAGAHHALERVRHLDHFLPVVPILMAAYEARIGQTDQARADWARAKRMQPILRVNPDILLARTALDAKTAARLKEWLAPVLR